MLRIRKTQVRAFGPDPGNLVASPPAPSPDPPAPPETAPSLAHATAVLPLRIRTEQMPALEKRALSPFEDDMVVHLREFAPEHCNVIGEDAVRKVIRLGMGRAESYGFTNCGPVRFYIELMFILGSDFDGDPQFPWAAQILSDQSETDQMTRANRLYGSAMDYIDTAFGPGYRHEKRALQKVIEERLEDWRRDESRSRAAMVARVKGIYPEKAEYVGNEALHGLIREAGELSEANLLSCPGAISVLFAVMFAFGHGALTDPQFAWVDSTLRGAEGDTPQERVTLFYSRLQAYLRKSLKRVDREFRHADIP